ncbi:MAG: hypothetical protein HC848_03530 [Limnobacter sp.]|nr:hypothetical protein [Limnobacter sp.]
MFTWFSVLVAIANSHKDAVAIQYLSVALLVVGYVVVFLGCGFYANRNVAHRG